MMNKMRIFVWLLIVQVHDFFGTKDTLNVCVLLEITQYRYSKWYAFFSDIIEHAFVEVQHRMDMLPEYSLKLISKDTQVTKFIFL